MIRYRAGHALPETGHGKRHLTARVDRERDLKSRILRDTRYGNAIGVSNALGVVADGGGACVNMVVHDVHTYIPIIRCWSGSSIQTQLLTQTQYQIWQGSPLLSLGADECCCDNLYGRGTIDDTSLLTVDSKNVNHSIRL